MANIKLFIEDRNKKVAELEPQKVNAVVMGVMHWLRSDLTSGKYDMNKVISNVLEEKCSELGAVLDIEFLERDKEKDVEI